MGAEQSYSMGESSGQLNYITLFINGKEYIVRADGNDEGYGPNHVLVDFLRTKVGLSGTKCMCRDGGCGCCTVTIKSLHPATQQQVIRSAHACLLPLYACDGLDITTIEGVGNARAGYNKFQDGIVKFGGTQCGFCSPGFVMNMYSYAQVNPRFTGGNIEYSLDGNICRCTGYRSITDAFKSFASDAGDKSEHTCVEIEESHKCPLQTKAEGDRRRNSTEIITLPRTIHIRNKLTEDDWIKVTNLAHLYNLLHKLTYLNKRYRLVAGNTGRGLYKNDGPYSTYIDINDISELRESSMDKSGLHLSSGTTLTEAIDHFMTAAKGEGFVYAAEFAKHFRRVASLTVRNSATLGGNLMQKHAHPEFISDVFVLFASVGANLQIGSALGQYRNYSLTEFLDLDMNGKLILSIHLPTFNSTYVFRCFKIATRYQNSEAYVNAALLFSVDRTNDFQVMERPSICFGGVNSTMTHARSTEEYLVGKQLNAKTLKTALDILEREAVPDANLHLETPDYRRGLCLSMLYKFILGIRKEYVKPHFKSGADDVERALNTGTQLESFPQVSGEAEFIDDIPFRPRELFGAFVISAVAKASIIHVDASEALSIPGVKAFITAKDIPGANNFDVFGAHQEEIFATTKVLYCGQPVGLILASNRTIAFEARAKVIIKYQDIQKPVLDIRHSVQQQKETKTKIEVDFGFPCRGITSQMAQKIVAEMEKKKSLLEDNKGPLPDPLYTLKGDFVTRGQYHYYMETQTCLCVPKEDGMDVYSSTQHMDSVQTAIAKCLKMPTNSINVVVRRLGGGFGGKGTPANLVATACAVAAYSTGHPVRVVLDLETNMKMIGKRLPYLTKYEAKVDNTGKIYRLKADMYCDTGAIPNEPSSLFATICLQSCYRATDWVVIPGVALTDTPPNTFCRSPGTAQAIAAIENIMEHIASVVKKDPLEVRQLNFIEKGDPLIGIPGSKLTTDNPVPSMISQLQKSADYFLRRNFVDTFNKANRWRKRGLSLVPLRVPVYYSDFRLPTFVSVSHVDGSVSVSHGGIEMGQGINTKVAQVVAYTLDIPLDNVRIKPSNNFVSPNAAITAASVTSELVCHSAKRACLMLLEKMQPVREVLGGHPTWQELVTACNAKGILLTAQHQDSQGDIIAYDVWAAAVAEVDVDILTGDYKVIRVDIVEDAGSSLSPMIDIGQIEGAFVMGMGWLLKESLVYDKDTGELLTCNTRDYQPLLPADIPEDFRVTLLRNAPNKHGVMSSKATGEPPLNLAISVMLALRNAIDSARHDVGNFEWYSMDTPVSKADIRRLALASKELFTL